MENDKSPAVANLAQSITNHPISDEAGDETCVSERLRLIPNGQLTGSEPRARLHNAPFTSTTPLQHAYVTPAFSILWALKSPIGTAEKQGVMAYIHINDLLSNSVCK